MTADVTMFGQKSRVQTGAILDVLHEDTMPSAGQELPVHGESGDNVTTLHSTGRHRLEWLPDGHVSPRDRTQGEVTPRSLLTQVGPILPDRSPYVWAL